MIRVLKPYAMLLWNTPYPEYQIEYCSRICYDTTDKLKTGSEEGDKMLRRLKKSGHLSCFEHASASFEITCSRACHVQIIRHRTMSYLAKSQRYVKVKEALDICLMNPATQEEEAFFNLAYHEYQRRILSGQRPEQAREVLPNATATRMCMTGNFTNWRRFLDMRLDKHAQDEIRYLAGQMAMELKHIAPVIFEDYDTSEWELKPG